MWQSHTSVAKYDTRNTSHWNVTMVDVNSCSAHGELHKWIFVKMLIHGLHVYNNKSVAYFQISLDSMTTKHRCCETNILLLTQHMQQGGECVHQRKWQTWFIISPSIEIFNDHQLVLTVQPCNNMVQFNQFPIKWRTEITFGIHNATTWLQFAGVSGGDTLVTMTMGTAIYYVSSCQGCIYSFHVWRLLYFP